MIVRILNYGQYRVGDEALEQLNDVDNRIEAAVESGDDRAFQACLTELVAAVQEHGELLPASEFLSSEAVVPSPGSTLEDARSLLTAEGLVPDGRR